MDEAIQLWIDEAIAGGEEVWKVGPAGTVRWDQETHTWVPVPPPAPQPDFLGDMLHSQ